MLPAPELCPVKVVGEEVLESVGSGGDQYRNLHNITNHCTRPMLNYPYHPKLLTAGEFSRYVDFQHFWYKLIVQEV